MLTRLALLTVLMLGLHHQAAVVGRDPTSHNQMTNRLRSFILNMIQQHEANVSSTIQHQVDNALNQLHGSPDNCTKNTQEVINKIKLNYENKLAKTCSFEKKYEDLLRTVEKNLGSLEKAIIGGGIEELMDIFQCFGIAETPNKPKGDSQPVEGTLRCLLFQALPGIFKSLGNDVERLVISLYDVVKVVFDGVDIIWKCMDQCLFISTLNRVLSENSKCAAL